MHRRMITLLPGGGGQQGSRFLTAIHCCLLAIIFPWLYEAFVRQIQERQDFFPAEQDKGALEILPTRGRQQPKRRVGAGSGRRDPSDLSSGRKCWGKYPQQPVDRTKLAKKTRWENKTSELAKVPARAMGTVLPEHFLPPANLCSSRRPSLRLVGHRVEELVLVTEEILGKHSYLLKNPSST